MEVDWQKSAYVPGETEIVVYDKEVDINGETLVDESGNPRLPEGRNEPYVYARFKFGDGITNVNELPFSNSVGENGLVFDENNSITGPTTEAYDGYAVSLGYENIAIPFEKESGMDDYFKEVVINTTDGETIIFDNKITGTTTDGTIYTEFDPTPVVLYFENTTINDLDIDVIWPVVSYPTSFGEVTHETLSDGRLKVSITSPVEYIGDRMYQAYGTQYTITRVKTSSMPAFLGYRYWSVSQQKYFYYNTLIEEFPVVTDIPLSDVEKIDGNYRIDINYLVPKIEAFDYAPIVLGYAGLAGGMGATTSGYRNVSIGNGTLTGGYHNKTISDTGTTVGANNVNYGNASFVGGCWNIVRTGNTIVHGSNNRVEKNNSDSAIFGHNNIAEENANINTSNLCAGKGNTLKSTTRATALFGTNNIVDTTNSLVAGYENTVGGNQNIVGGYRNNVTSTISIVSGSGNKSQSIASATFGNSNTNTGNYAIIAGSGNNGSGEASITLGLTNTNNGKGSFVVGEGNVNINGGRIIVAGRSNTIDGIVHGSAVFGCENKVKDGSSFANAESAVLCAGKLNTVEARVGFSSVIGHNNTLGTATNASSIQGNAVFGGYNTLVANYSFISGSYNTISNNVSNSFVSGNNCTVGRSIQRVFGQYNVANTLSDSVRYVDIVGWGSKSNPKNIYTLDTNGNATFAGTVTANGSTLATEEYVDNALGYNNITLPFDDSVEDYLASSSLTYYFDVDQQLVFTDMSVLDEGKTYGGIKSDTRYDSDPLILYYNNCKASQIFVDFEEEQGPDYTGYPSYQATDMEDGSVRVNIYSYVKRWSGSLYQKVATKYTVYVRNHKEYKFPATLGYRYFDITKNAYEYRSVVINSLPYYVSDVQSFNVKQDDSGAYCIDINYLIPVTENKGCAPVSLGYVTTAAGQGALATGYRTVSVGNGTFTSGCNNRTVGRSGATFGYDNINCGDASFVAGVNCVAKSSIQRVFGQYNAVDTAGEYVDIIGWGTSDTDRKNIYTLDKSGNAIFAGTVTANGGALVTTAYVDNALKDIDLSNYVTKEYLDEKLTQIENVVDRILEIQNSLIGGKQ